MRWWPGLLLMVACVSAPRPTPDAQAAGAYRQTVREVVADHVLDAELCYHTTFDLPPPTGQVRLGFWIAGDGKVAQAEIERADFDGREFKECMVAMAMRWQFPPPPTHQPPVRVSFPYVFSTRAD